ncbi:Developmental and secondary metabolism regulator veA like [Actinidia chinensis var. chinensis]|uniref:Developmental and secondary metabolism regulator veA like n=1 Tax=Actinidia chinensis var. chinensis TaxID=1590841 RepID=A0A2R6Q1M4_ACTCC|nr:Developmental and secondary metabolism regulator veA like [Actinidia chinensis var. chinensis]
MDEFGSERSKTWNIYTSSDPSPSQTPVDRDATSQNLGTSMNAISFGFVATAVLISMFLLMAIFEHLFRPSPSFSSPQDGTNRSPDARSMEKLRHTQEVSAPYASDFSVVMPGQHYPTYIAQPAPLPCPREGVYWPFHEQNPTLP